MILCDANNIVLCSTCPFRMVCTVVPHMAMYLNVTDLHVITEVDICSFLGAALLAFMPSVVPSLPLCFTQTKIWTVCKGALALLFDFKRLMQAPSVLLLSPHQTRVASLSLCHSKTCLSRTSNVALCVNPKLPT